jgi:hypothetical protein
VIRRTVHRVVLPLALLVAGGGGAGGWWYLTNGRFPLAGDLRHDFGEVRFVGRSTTVEHTFHLRNRTSGNVVIDKLVPSCGCTLAEVNDTVIEPGDEVRLHAKLALSGIGGKRTHVQILLRDRSPMSVWLRATAIRTAALVPTVDRVELDAEGRARATVMIDLQDPAQTPGTPELTAGPGIEATFAGWERVREGDEDEAVAARWRGVIDLRVLDDRAPARSALVIRLGEETTSLTVTREVER